MNITFLGTRGNIKAKTRRHKRHTVTLVQYRRTKIMIDCGLDWLGKIKFIKPDAIILTHAHPDHAFGLKKGAPCPVYASDASWQIIETFPIYDQYEVKIQKPFHIGSIQLEAFFVVHSLRAPAIGYRISAGKKVIFCVHDLISIPKQKKALSGVDLYIGDGASITRPIIRKKNDQPFGHTTIRSQLNWCQKEKVPRAIFTHCGSQIVTGDERILGAKVKALGAERNVQAMIAHDGLKIQL